MNKNLGLNGFLKAKVRQSELKLRFKLSLEKHVEKNREKIDSFLEEVKATKSQKATAEIILDRLMLNNPVRNGEFISPKTKDWEFESVFKHKFCSVKPITLLKAADWKEIKNIEKDVFNTLSHREIAKSFE